MCLGISFCRCLEWLLNNLMTHQNVDLMKELGYVCSQFFSFTLLLAYILYLGIIRTFLKMVVAKFYTSMYLMITVCCLIKIILISFSAVTFFNKDNQMTVMSNCVSNHNVKISSMTILAICLCTAYTGQR